MLRLTDGEMDIVLAAARPLTAQERDGFLHRLLLNNERCAGCSGDLLPPSPPANKHYQ
jgi:hypothetical protein